MHVKSSVPLLVRFLLTAALGEMIFMPQGMAKVDGRVLAVSPQAIGSTHHKLPSSRICDGVDFGSFSFSRVKGRNIHIDSDWKEQNTQFIWFFATKGESLREIDGKLYRTTQIRVNRKAFESGCQAFLRARNILAERPDLMRLVKTVSVFRESYSKGSPKLSSHAWGLAIDINAADYPYGIKVKNPHSPNAILWREVFSKAGFRWGNHFSNVGGASDPMHFDIPIKK
jgi:hypothetical protein